MLLAMSEQDQRRASHGHANLRILAAPLGRWALVSFGCVVLFGVREY